MTPHTVCQLIAPDGEKVFGPGPLELLSRVERLGSLSQAARQMGMSYSKAIRIVKEAERSLGHTLTKRAIGGDGGGSSKLTSYGTELLRRFELWQACVQEGSTLSFASCFAGMMEQSPLGCVVMASGMARRYGQQKLLEKFGETTIIEATLSALASSFLELVVVTPWPEVARLCASLGVRHVAPEGPLQSDTVRAGVCALGTRAGYLFAQGDQPGVNPASIQALIGSFCKNPQLPARLSYDGKSSAPIVFPGWMEADLASLTGDVGGSALLRQNPMLARHTTLVEATSASEVLDVDTPADLALLTQMLEEQQVSMPRAGSARARKEAL